MQQIRQRRLGAGRSRRTGARRERPWHEVLSPDPRDPDVVRAKALARAGHPDSTATATPSSEPVPEETS